MLECIFQQLCCAVGKRTEHLELSGGNVRVAENLRAGKPFALPLPRGVDPHANVGGGFRRRAGGELIKLDRRYLNMQINAIEQRPGDARHILLRRAGRAGAGSGRMSEKAAGAGIHRRRKHKGAGVAQRGADARDRDRAVLERLAQALHRRPRKFRQLVQKQHAVMRQRDLARARNAAAARQPRGGYGVVRRAERPRPHKPRAARQRARHRINFRDLERLLARQIRQDRGQALGEHTFSRAGRPDQQDVMAARCRHLHGAAGAGLPHDVGKVRQRRRLCPVRLARQHRRKRLLPREVPQKRHDLADRIYRDSLDDRALGGIFRRNECMADAVIARRDHHRQHAAHRPHLSRQRQLAEKGTVVKCGAQLSACDQQRNQQRQIIDRPLFFHVGRREVYRDAADRIGEAAVFERGTDAVTRLLHRRAGQPDHVKPRQPLRQIRFHRDGKPVHSHQSHAVYTGKHRRSPPLYLILATVYALAWNLARKRKK